MKKRLRYFSYLSQHNPKEKRLKKELRYHSGLERIHWMDDECAIHKGF